MKYTFQRNIVTPDNKTYLRGSEVPAVVANDVILRWLEDGIVVGIESPTSFSEKIGKKRGKVDPDVEALDPDNKTRSE